MTRATRRRARLAAAAGLAVAGALTGPALAGAAPAASTSPASQAVAPGGSFTLSGTGCVLEGDVTSYVRVLLQADSLRVLNSVVRAAPDGSWTITNTLPAGLAEKPYYVVPTCYDPQDQTFTTYILLPTVVVDVGGTPPSTTTTTSGGGPGTTTATATTTTTTGHRPQGSPEEAAKRAEKVVRAGGLRSGAPSAVRATPRYTG